MLLDGIASALANESFMDDGWSKAVAANQSATVRLSIRELEVLRLYASGLPLAVIATRLNLSRSSATEYLRRIRRKYAENGLVHLRREEALAIATERGLALES